MTPGTVGRGAVELYRATRFPFEWTLERVLARLPAVTTTVHRAGGRWWFFVAVADVPGQCATLLLFHAGSPVDEWTAHPASPIASDVRTARAAGPIAAVDGRWIRPSRDESVRHGCRVTLNEIVTLTPDEYLETPLRTLGPARAGRVTGIATYNRIGDVEVVDGYVGGRLPVLAR
jgi:hypothetical protein